MAEAGFLDLMPHTITVAARGSTRSLYGVPGAAGTATSYRARVVQAPQWVRDSDGTRLLASAVAWVSSTASVPADGVWTLPDGTTPPVLWVARYPDENGLHHTKIVFGTRAGSGGVSR